MGPLLETLLDKLLGGPEDNISARIGRHVTSFAPPADQAVMYATPYNASEHAAGVMLLGQGPDHILDAR